MEVWLIIVVSISLALLLKALVNLLFSPSAAATTNLPPGPPTVPIFGPLAWLRRNPTEIEAILHNLFTKFGPIVALRIGSRPSIFVADRSLVQQALVHDGALFADRPPALPTSKIMTCNQHSINSASYGPTWRVLRRNLTAEILHPSRVKSYKHARKWVLGILIDGLKTDSKIDPHVRVMDHFQYAMFCLLVLMCFGDKLDEKEIKQIKRLHQSLLVGFNRFNILNFWPRVTKILLHKRWKEFWELREERRRVLGPIVERRKKLKEGESLNKAMNDANGEDQSQTYVLSYVDTLLDLQLPDEKRKLNEDEIVSLCSEFVNAGTDTTSTALQWIMANLVKYPQVQQNIYMEISGVMKSDGAEEVKEEELNKLKYLKAVILEGLRRHPPTHFVLPHSVTQDVELGGYRIPKLGSINFMVAEMGWDPKVWEEPMAFKPERFLSDDEFDITGSRDVKMMPFGVGRRICPGLGLALLHLEYFVANLVWKFQWKAVEGVGVDLSEKQEFTIVMKNPLQAIISPRIR